MREGETLSNSGWKIETPLIGPALLALLVIALAAVPFFGGTGTMRLMVEIFAMIAMAQAWNLLAGYTGFVSVGQQAFIGIGAYGLFMVALKEGIDPFSSVLLGGICGFRRASRFLKKMYRWKYRFSGFGRTPDGMQSPGIVSKCPQILVYRDIWLFFDCVPL